MKETYVLTIAGDDYLEGYVDLTSEEAAGVVKALAALSSSGQFAPLVSFRIAETNEELSEVVLRERRSSVARYNEAQSRLPHESAMAAAFKKAMELVS